MVTSIETIAAIFAIFGLIKLLVIIIDKKSWMPVTRGVYGNPNISAPILLILALIVFYYLIQELNIVQIFAVGCLFSLIMGLGFMSLNKELLSLASKIIKKNFSVWMWVYILVWMAGMIWVLYEVFA